MLEHARVPLGGTTRRECLHEMQIPSPALCGPMSGLMLSAIQLLAPDPSPFRAGCQVGHSSPVPGLGNDPIAPIDLMGMTKGRVPADDLVRLPVGDRIDQVGQSRAVCICGVGGRHHLVLVQPGALDVGSAHNACLGGCGCGVCWRRPRWSRSGWSRGCSRQRLRRDLDVGTYGPCVRLRLGQHPLGRCLGSVVHLPVDRQVEWVADHRPGEGVNDA